MKRNLMLAATVVSFGSSALMAQDDDKSRKATPDNIGTWARSIQMDYPSEALRNEEEGAVSMQIVIDPSGRVSRCAITESSGSAALDKAACDGMTLHARYNPELNALGEPVSTSMMQRIRYVLPEGSYADSSFSQPQPVHLDEWSQKIRADYPDEAISRGLEGAVRISIMVDSQGVVRGCLVPPDEANRLLQAAACAGAIRYAQFEPQGHGDTYVSYSHIVHYELPQ